MLPGRESWCGRSLDRISRLGTGPNRVAIHSTTFRLLFLQPFLIALHNLMNVLKLKSGSSGAILSYIMCVAMNRNLPSVLFGGFGSPTGESIVYEGSATETSVMETVDILRESDRYFQSIST
jgi:hypothetical protein